MAITIDSPQGKDQLNEFIRFHDQVYQHRSAHWPAVPELQLPLLLGESPFTEGRTIRPFMARQAGTILARAVAVVDRRYHRHWNERLGHITMFESMPEGREATKLLLDTSCEWLEKQGAIAARAGFGLFEMPFVIDDYESLPPMVARENPDYYHRFLKDAGFESEQGWVDYKIEVRAELVVRWETALDAARRGGYNIVPLKDVPEKQRAREFCETWNDTFKTHWGFSPFIEGEIAILLEAFAPDGVLDTSVLAYRDGAPVGMLFVVRETAATAVCKPGRVLADSEKLNLLAIGVRESARGCGVNLGMAAAAFLELVRRGAKYLSYTLVLDDNWPSRRTAEKLGAFVCANYLVYRRNFRR